MGVLLMDPVPLKDIDCGSEELTLIVCIGLGISLFGCEVWVISQNACARVLIFSLFMY